MKVLKSISLILIPSLFLSCVPVDAGRVTITPGNSPSQFSVRAGSAACHVLRERRAPQGRRTTPHVPLTRVAGSAESMQSRPWFGKNSAWSDWYKWRHSFPGFLTNPNTGKSVVYPEEAVSPSEKFFAEMLEKRLRDNFSRRRLPETIVSTPLAASLGLSALSLDRLKAGLYAKLPVPALATDITVGAVDSLLAGKSAEKVLQRGVIGRAARTMTNIALLWALKKAGERVSDRVGLHMPSNKFAAGALWLASIPVFWIVEDIKNLAVDGALHLVGKPFTWMRQKINHLRNKSIWEHNKPLFAAHFTDQLMIGDHSFDACVRIERECMQHPENQRLQEEYYAIRKHYAKGNVSWAPRPDSDPRVRGQALEQAKMGLKNDQCPECWELFRTGRFGDVCCVGRYSF